MNNREGSLPFGAFENYFSINEEAADCDKVLTPICIWNQQYQRIHQTFDVKVVTLYWSMRIAIGIFCFLLAFTMLTNKKFNMHPYQLYALELLFFSGWIFDIRRFLLETNNSQVFLKLIEIFDYMVIPTANGDNEVNTIYARVILYWSEFMQFLWFQIFLLLNLILSLDVFYLLKNPFKPPRIRTKSYYIIVGIFTLLMFTMAGIVYYFRFTDPKKQFIDPVTQKDKKDSLALNGSFQLLFVTIFYPLIALINAVVIIWVSCRLRRIGTSPNLKREIRCRYILYFFMSIPFYAVSILRLVTETAYDNGSQPDSTYQNIAQYLQWYLYILQFVMLVIGFLKALTRLSEAYVRYTLLEIILNSTVIKKLCCRSKKMKDVQTFKQQDDESKPRVSSDINVTDSRNKIDTITSVNLSANKNSFEFQIKKKNMKINKLARNQSLNSFLNKAINVEYVYLILSGIIRIMNAQEQKFEGYRLMKQKLHLLEVASQSQGTVSMYKGSQQNIEEGSQNHMFVDTFCHEFFMSSGRLSAQVNPMGGNQTQFLGQFNWVFKKKQKKQNLTTMVNIEKDQNKTKINMEYVDIMDPFEDEMLNDKEFLQQFENVTQFNSILNEQAVAADLPKNFSTANQGLPMIAQMNNKLQKQGFSDLVISQHEKQEFNKESRQTALNSMTSALSYDSNATQIIRNNGTNDSLTKMSNSGDITFAQQSNEENKEEEDNIFHKKNPDPVATPAWKNNRDNLSVIDEEPNMSTLGQSITNRNQLFGQGNANETNNFNYQEKSQYSFKTYQSSQDNVIAQQDKQKDNIPSKPGSKYSKNSSVRGLRQVPSNDSEGNKPQFTNTFISGQMDTGSETYQKSQISGGKKFNQIRVSNQSVRIRQDLAFGALSAFGGGGPKSNYSGFRQTKVSQPSNIPLIYQKYDEFKRNKNPGAGGGDDTVSQFSTFTKKEKKAVITFSEEVIQNKDIKFRKLDRNFEITKSNKKNSISPLNQGHMLSTKGPVSLSTSNYSSQKKSSQKTNNNNKMGPQINKMFVSSDPIYRGHNKILQQRQAQQQTKTGALVQNNKIETAKSTKSKAKTKVAQKGKIASQGVDISEYESSALDSKSKNSKDQDNVTNLHSDDVSNLAMIEEEEENEKESLRIPIKCQIQSSYEELFNDILEMDGLSQKSLIESLDVELNRKAVFRAGEGAGASGSFFFFSEDHRFIIKTLTSEEVKLLEIILQDYLRHIQNMENQSMLARIYGLFTITTNYFVPLNVMVMQNTFQSSGNKSDCILKFDLKGSRIARNVKNMTDPETQMQINQAKTEAEFFKAMHTDKTLKDINFVKIDQALQNVQRIEQKKNADSKDLKEPEGLIRIQESDLKALAACLEKDTAFLQDLDIMDYSLYVVVEHLPEPLPPSKKVPAPQLADSALSVSYRGSALDSRGLQKSQAGQSQASSGIRVIRKRRFNEFGRNIFISKDRTLVYHIGVIDYLQEWNGMKRMERFWKQYVRRQDGKWISALEPKGYRTRFLLSMIHSVLDSDQETAKCKLMLQEIQRDIQKIPVDSILQLDSEAFTTSADDEENNRQKNKKHWSKKNTRFGSKNKDKKEKKEDNEDMNKNRLALARQQEQNFFGAFMQQTGGQKKNNFNLF